MKEEIIRSLWHIRYIIRKEFLVLLADPRMRVILFLPALLQSLLFGYVASFNLEKVPYAVLDQTHSRSSVDILSKLDGTGVFYRTRTLYSSNELAEAIDSGDAIMVITFGPDFERKLALGEPAPVQVITDGRNTMTASLASGYMGRIVETYNMSLGMEKAIHLETVTWYNPNQESRWTFLPSMVAMLCFTQVVMLAGFSVARERDQGTFDQLLVAPVSPMEILIGKAIPPLIIGLVQASIVLLVIKFWFQIPNAGSLFELYITLAVFILSCVGIGLSISAVVDNMQQVMVYALVLILPMVLLSGFTTPVSNMPEVLQLLTYIDPLRFALECVRRIYLEGATLGEVAWNFIPMLAVAGITLPLAAWLFRNKLL